MGAHRPMLPNCHPIITAAKQRSVLVVDDVAEIQRLVEHWLGDLGWPVWSVSSGREAGRFLGRQPVDLVVTDVIMPDGDGLEVIAEVRRRQPRARVLAISGGGLHLHAADCLKLARSLGAHAVLLKPFRREQLLEAIGSVLELNLR